MFTAPTISSVQELRVVCQDNRLAQLCDEGIITAMMSYNPNGNYSNTVEILTVAAVLKRLKGNLTVESLCMFLDNHGAIAKGMLALVQDGVSTFDNSIGNFLDISSGFENGKFFVSKERYDSVWTYLGMCGVAVPQGVRNFQLYDINVFGEPGLWIEPVTLGLDGYSIRA
ncbi:hypothetical protein BIZ83_gp006 [Erwinia phage vB_EamM_ChrisDB]|uniref:hypothetical protein n=1 Tax=Erwinia phage vB_EamM_ChrisDB TaxID=1883371 RepID=UPI00081CEA3D|nr:hypothetical protein BIZ83_gp006 [Erwinia phage vB_EamM_ChrisDB]ANZ48847.1 hypothetical protein CHRISDB_285 [Erwinia phage vB_EamM_ChrisDB]